MKNSLVNSKKSNLIYFIVAPIIAIGTLSALVISKKEPTGLDVCGFMFWCGVLTAWTAKRNNKPATLWFFIGFVPISFILLVLISFLKERFLSN
jgi:hypothetical protein